MLQATTACALGVLPRRYIPQTPTIRACIMIFFHIKRWRAEELLSALAAVTRSN